MPNSCCVPGCNTNYKDNDNEKVFKFPNDDARKKVWLKAIPRKDLIITKHTSVCHLHFEEKFLIKADILKQNGKLYDMV